MILPNVIIAGAPKCGTTSLFEYLAAHPAVCPATVKETRYLIDKDYPLYHQERSFLRRGLVGYSEFFQKHIPGLHKIFIEATPDYMYQNTPLKVLPLFERIP